MPADFEKRAEDDFLDRTALLQALRRHIADLAAIPPEHLAAPRVLAVDAPWGFGKSWVATRFHRQLTESDPKRAVLIDAFRHDHHDDVFGVIAAAILATLRPSEERKKEYLRTAGKVLEATVPSIAQGLAGAAMKLVQIDPGLIADVTEKARDALVDGMGTLSASAIEKLFDRYTKTESQQADFQAALGELTKDLAEPFVVVIDELDRCRPSFALECLERIKHLFSAERVVFVLFWNSRSVHESVRHTYGRGTDAAAYLSKFVSLSLQLTLPERGRRTEYSPYAEFIQNELTRIGVQAESFGDSLAEIAVPLHASLRDVQKSFAMFGTARRYGAEFSNGEFAYLSLLLSIESSRFFKLLDSDPAAIKAEWDLLPTPSFDGRPSDLDLIWALLAYRSDSYRYDEMASRGGTPDREDDASVVAWLQLGDRRGYGGQLDRVGDVIKKLLNTTRYRVASTQQ